MKVALFISENRKQIVLTPENEHEESVCGLLDSDNYDLEIKSGSFYSCAGGWDRQGQSGNDDQSTIIVLSKKPENNKKEKGTK